MREALDALWKEPERAEEMMRELRVENEYLYKFEEMLEAENHIEPSHACVFSINLLTI